MLEGNRTIPKGMVALDEKDRKILVTLMEDPEASQQRVAQSLGISQPTVSLRLRKLKNLGLLRHWYGISLRDSGLYLAKVDVATRDVSLLECFRFCPYFLNGFITSGKHNVVLFFVSEDLRTLEAIIDGHIRSIPEVDDIEFSIVITPLKELIHPLNITRIEDKEKSELCKKMCPAMTKGCDHCYYYREGRCTGCPLTEWYRGTLWRGLRA